MKKQSTPSLQEDSNHVCMGLVTAPHGIRGAVKVKAYTVNPQSLTSYGPLMNDQGHVYSLKILSQAGPDMLVVQIEGVKDRNQAEALKGTRLFVARDTLPCPNDDEFYYSDLIGLRVISTDGVFIGHIMAVNNYGAGDFLEAKREDGQLITIPFRKEAGCHVDLELGQVTVDSEYILSTK